MPTEDQLEQHCLARFREGGWSTAFGSDVPRRTLATVHETFLSKLLRGELSVAEISKS